MRREPVGASAGFTYLELIATAAILMILASAILPMARVTRTRQKEIELRRELREHAHGHRPLQAGGATRARSAAPT